jgi:hypothetical protein
LGLSRGHFYFAQRGHYHFAATGDFSCDFSSDFLGIFGERSIRNRLWIGEFAKRFYAPSSIQRTMPALSSARAIGPDGQTVKGDGPSTWTALESWTANTPRVCSA